MRLLFRIKIFQEFRRVSKALGEAKFQRFRYCMFLRSEVLLSADEDIAKNYIFAFMLFIKEMELSIIIVILNGLFYSFILILLFTVFSALFLKPLNDHSMIFIFAFMGFFSLSLFFFNIIFVRRWNRRYVFPMIIQNLVDAIINLSLLNSRRMLERADINALEKALEIVDNGQEMLDNLQKEVRFLQLGIKKIEEQKLYNDDVPDDTIYFKHKVILHLEETARLIERYLPYRLRSKDIITDEWFKREMREVAAGLRDKKMWVLTPMEDTYDNLIGKMFFFLECVLNDNWHALVLQP